MDCDAQQLVAFFAHVGIFTPMTITAAQSRAARGLIDMTQAQLALAARVSLRTITFFENGQRQPVPATLEAIRGALESGGVVFQGDGQDAPGGPGVRLKGTV